MLCFLRAEEISEILHVEKKLPFVWNNHAKRNFRRAVVRLGRKRTFRTATCLEAGWVTMKKLPDTSQNFRMRIKSTLHETASFKFVD